MSKDECCGNCNHFKHEDTRGKGWCEEQSWVTECSKVCKCHEPDLNGWTEITPDNVDEVDCMPRETIVIGWIKKSKMNVMVLNTFWFTLESMAMQGGFYYYVLPELKI